jgi:hypothetical protein
MTIKELEFRKQKLIEEYIPKFKRDYERLNKFIILCEESVQKVTLDNVADYAKKIDEIQDSFEMIEIYAG